MDMRVKIAGVEWNNPVTVASGTFGSGEEYSEFVDLNRLGAVTTKGVANVPQLEQEIRLVYEGLRECILPADYTEDLIRWFREKGYRIYFLSNYSEGLYEKTKDRLHFIESFHGGVFSWKEKCLKPDARIYRILLKRYDLNPASCLFFDDREDNVVAACREDRKSTRLNSSHSRASRMPSSA